MSEPIIKFPNEIDDNESLLIAENNIESILTQDITNSQTTFTISPEINDGYITFLDTKDEKYKSRFLKTIGRLEPERIDQFLISENVPEQIRNQDFGEKSERAKARDIINQFIIDEFVTSLAFSIYCNHVVTSDLIKHLELSDIYNRNK